MKKIIKKPSKNHQKSIKNQKIPRTPSAKKNHEKNMKKTIKIEGATVYVKFYIYLWNRIV